MIDLLLSKKYGTCSFDDINKWGLIQCLKSNIKVYPRVTRFVMKHSIVLASYYKNSRTGLFVHNVSRFDSNLIKDECEDREFKKSDFSISYKEFELEGNFGLQDCLLVCLDSEKFKNSFKELNNKEKLSFEDIANVVVPLYEVIDLIKDQSKVQIKRKLN